MIAEMLEFISLRRLSHSQLEMATCDEETEYLPRSDHIRTRHIRNAGQLARALQDRGRHGKVLLAEFESWLVASRRSAVSTAKRKRRLVWSALCDHPEAPYTKTRAGHSCDACRGVQSISFGLETRSALREYCEFVLAHRDRTAWDASTAWEWLDEMGFDLDEVKAGVVRMRIELGTEKVRRGATR
jgi:hypothetical protein